MNTYLIILLITGLIEIGILCFWFYRDSWVAKQQMVAWDNGMEFRIATHDYMLDHWWCFDMEKFLDKEAL